MTRRTIHGLLLGVVLLLVAGAVGGWWYVAIGRYPLAGDRAHDFGDIAIVELSASKTHTFRLRNRTRSPVVIESIHPGCGCTKVEPSTRHVEPGAEVEFEVTLSLAKAGKKRTHVTLMLEDFGPEMLFVEGVGRKALSVSASTSTLALPRGVTTPMHVFADLQGTDDHPPAPVISAPAGVTATFAGWQRAREGDAGRATATRWQGRVEVALTDGELPDRARLMIEVGRAVPVVVALREERAASTGS